MDLLTNIDIKPLKLSINQKLSGIELQNFWWVIILLLFIDWYFRKKIGLL